MSKDEFEDISIPKWKLSISGMTEGGPGKAYRVFTSRTEFVTVEAVSATDAVLKSGLTKVYMVKIGARDDMTMLDRSMLALAQAAPNVVPVCEELPPAIA